jgi:alpha-L-fucosidase
VKVTNVTSGLVLDSGGSVASGSNLKQWSYNGSTNHNEYTITAA